MDADYKMSQSCLVKLKYSIVTLSEVNRTRGIQHEMTNPVLIRLGSYFEAIISNCNLNICYSHLQHANSSFDITSRNSVSQHFQ